MYVSHSTVVLCIQHYTTHKEISVLNSICLLRWRTRKKVTACKILDEKYHTRYEIKVNMIFHVLHLLLLLLLLKTLTIAPNFVHVCKPVFKKLVHRHIIFLLTPLLLEKLMIISPDTL